MNLASLLPAKYAKWNKAIVALLGSAVAAVVYHFGNADFVAPLVQLATVFGVYHTENK